MNSQYNKQTGHITIKTTPRKIIITVRKGEVDQFIILCFWLLGWSIGGVFVLNGFVRAWYHAIFSQPHSSESGLVWILCYPVAFISVASIMIMALMFGTARIMTIFFTPETRLFGSLVLLQTRLVITRDTMRITTSKLWKRERTHSYALETLSNVRLAQRGKAHHTTVLFDEGTRTLACCDTLHLHDALQILHLLFGLVQFRCQTVERIIFTSPDQVGHDSAHTLWNPEVSALMVPFVRLKQIGIVTNSYQFHQVERFLTYAINVLGQEYVKHHLEVHLYGEREKLPSHLQNNLTNVCKQMYLHHEHEFDAFLEEIKKEKNTREHPVNRQCG